MKTITYTTYQCEICNTEYHCKELAKECEKSVLPPCPIEVGTRVQVVTR